MCQENVQCDNQSTRYVCCLTNNGLYFYRYPARVKRRAKTQEGRRSRRSKRNSKFSPWLVTTTHPPLLIYVISFSIAYAHHVSRRLSIHIILAGYVYIPREDASGVGEGWKKGDRTVLIIEPQQCQEERSARARACKRPTIYLRGNS